MKPRGATEIQHEFLEKYVDKDLLSKFQICTSIPGKVPLDPNKINILWQKNSWDQPNLQNFFRLIPRIFLETKIDTMNMIGMFLTHTGLLKNLDTFFKYLKINLL